MSMPRQRRNDDQHDLFFSPLMAPTVEIPPWQSLPAETRGRLTVLMIRLILESAGANRVGGLEGKRDEQ
jgi:hypothetical protein